MLAKVVNGVRGAQETLHAVAQGIVALLAASLIVASLLAAFGIIPWPQIALFFGGQAVPQAGMWLQLGLTGLLLLLLIFLPGNFRISRLERSHRKFALSMEDVARAYRQVHAADRAGVFALSSEFDTMRTRMEHMRQHPDLQHLEPELLQIAAQMSLETRELVKSLAGTVIGSLLLLTDDEGQNNEQLKAYFDAYIKSDEFRTVIMGQVRALAERYSKDASLIALIVSVFGAFFDLIQGLELDANSARLLAGEEK